MIASSTRMGALALIFLCGVANQADACWFRSAPVYYYPCYPCDPCQCVFHELEPSVPLHGPYPKMIFKAKVGDCFILKVNDPAGTQVGVKEVSGISNTNGHIEFVGSNVKHAHIPGGTNEYRIFLKAVKAGGTNFTVDFLMKDGNTIKVPFVFDVQP